MGCSCCAFGDTADEHFNTVKLAKELSRYRRKGPGQTTRRLRDGIVSAGLQSGTLLDIGGGLGILSLELLEAGFNHATVVDASSAYLAAAFELAREGFVGTCPCATTSELVDSGVSQCSIELRDDGLVRGSLLSFGNDLRKRDRIESPLVVGADRCTARSTRRSGLGPPARA